MEVIMRLRTYILTLFLVLFTIIPAFSQQFHGVCVGIADYPGTVNDLNCPDDNAEDFRSYLITHQGWSGSEIELILDDDATEEGITDAIEAMTMGSGHTCVFFYSGHGDSQELGGSNGLIPYDEGRLHPTELQSCFDRGYSQYACFIDACGSGIFPDDMSRGVISSACDNDEKEYESYGGHSFWSYYLLAGLNSSAADSDAQGDDNGIVTAEELYFYADQRTTTLSSGDMHPQIYSMFGYPLHFESCPRFSIDGPDQVVYGEQGTWSTTVYDGQTPYSYAWYHRKSGTWNSGGSSSSANIYLDYAGTGTYQLKCIVTDDNGAYDEEIIHVVVEEEDENNKVASTKLPKTFSLRQNYPNPFNPVTTIKYELPKAANVTLVVYNILGQEVARLVNTNMPAGYHSIKWDASNVASGTYIYKIVAGKFTTVKKMVVIK